MIKWYRGFRPIHPWGWVVYVFVAGLLVWDYRAIHSTAQSTGDIIFTFFPHLAGAFLLLAVIVNARRE